MKQEDLPQAGEIYRHFKGERYVVEGLAVNTDYNDARLRVEYKSLFDEDGQIKGTRYSSSLERFLGEKVFEKDEELNSQKFKKGDIVKRFIKVYPTRGKN